MNKFRVYIEGSKITVASDHQPLKRLMKLKSPSGRLDRWALQLQYLNLNLEYIPGKYNVVADMLSRLDFLLREYSFHRLPCKIAHGDKRRRAKRLRSPKNHPLFRE
ncbi:hypothetical protein AVEN_108105-1 [Araneus ventricosus]|uniref:Reverse transcriptase RNase H-like domain-containing protein n=1 Tax=Araneus ventricosus TaxID=182803 RepID=A0A4Y2H489_ARAVE|nr:hypothetical protein AVEN_108105-1 [Araneus ventricosus]